MTKPVVKADGADQAIARALDFLAQAQLANGSFRSESSASKNPFKATHTYQTILVPALILDSLASCRNTAANTIKDKLARYLLTQAGNDGSFNYWDRGAPEQQTMPYPDDLDDTFCAVSALHAHDPALIDGHLLGKVVYVLVAAETAVGGPYRTWLVPDSSDPVWQDVDVAVNANVGYFLAQLGSPVPGLTDYLEARASSDQLTSPYYPSVYATLFYLARAFGGGADPGIRAKLDQLKTTAGHWGTPLQTALALNALGRLGDTASHSAAIQTLLRTQKRDGSWPAEAFCIDPKRQGKTHYNGAPALTTALALSALQYQATPAETGLKPSKKSLPDADATCRRLAQSVGAELDRLDHDVQASAKQVLERLLDGTNAREIVLLPRLFQQALSQPGTIPDGALDALSRANIYGWMAYTVYDDFLDDAGDVRLLSAAHVAHRRSLTEFLAAVTDTTFQRQVRETFDAIDAANAWEVMHCRLSRTDHKLDGIKLNITPLPYYGRRQKLAQRSLGHALTPLAVLHLAGASRRHCLAMKKAFMHYLIARQIGDDMHDWEQDLAAGHASFVVTRILRDLHTKPGTYDYDALHTAMQQQFWHHAVHHVLTTARGHVLQAKLLTPPIFTASPLEPMLMRLEQVFERTEREQIRAQQFLDSIQLGQK